MKSHQPPPSQKKVIKWGEGWERGREDRPTATEQMAAQQKTCLSPSSSSHPSAYVLLRSSTTIGVVSGAKNQETLKRGEKERERPDFTARAHRREATLMGQQQNLRRN